MTDFTQQIVDWRSKEIEEKSPGATFAKKISASKKAEEDKRIDGKFRSAYETSGLDSAGISEEIYDFKEAYVNGSTFKPHGSGIELPNKFVKERGIEIAGRDFRTGVPYRNKYLNSPEIDKGIKILKESKINTEMGPPWDDVEGLSRIAMGIADQGGTYEDFLSELDRTPWSKKTEQAAVAWASVDLTRKATHSAENYNQEFVQDFLQPDDAEFDLGVGELPDIIVEEDLPTTPAWIEAGRKIIEFNTGETTEGMTDEEVSEQLLDTMGMFFHNIPEQALMAYNVVSSEDPEYAKAFLTAIEIYDRTDMNNWNEMGRFLKGGLLDLTNYVSFGGGALATKLAGNAIRSGIKKRMVKMLSGLAVESAVGAAAGASYSLAEQNVMKAAGVTDAIDYGEASKMAGMSAALTAAIGGPINVMSDPSLRSFASKAARNGWNNLHAGQPKPPGSLAAQRGSIGVPQAKPRWVDPVVQKLDEWYPDSASIDVNKLERKLQQEVNAGNISQEAVDWFSFDWIKSDLGDNVSKDDIKSLMQMMRSKPEFVDIPKPRWGNYTINQDLPGYSEIVITVPSEGQFSGHFEGDIAPGMTNVGHIRYHDLGDTMLILEEQSDAATAAGRWGTYGTGMFGEGLPREVALKETERSLPSKYPVDQLRKFRETNAVQLAIAQREGIDVTQKNAPAKIWAAATPEEKEMISNFVYGMPRYGVAPKTPYLKTWPKLMMRQQIMQAVSKGKKEILWPSSIDQLDIIEHWGGNTNSPMAKGASKHLLKEKAKVAKQLGLKVDQVDRPDLVGSGIEIMVSDIDPADFVTNEDIHKGFIEELTRLGATVRGSFSADDLEIFDGPIKIWGLERSLRNPEDVEYLLSAFGDEFINVGNDSSSTFNRIQITPEVIEEWTKKGVPFIGASGVAVGVSEQKRDEQGRFTK